MKKYNVKKSWEVVNEQVGFGTTVFDYNEAIQMVQDYGGRYLDGYSIVDSDDELYPVECYITDEEMAIELCKVLNEEQQ